MAIVTSPEGTSLLISFQLDHSHTNVPIARGVSDMIHLPTSRLTSVKHAKKLLYYGADGIAKNAGSFDESTGNYLVSVVMLIMLQENHRRIL